MPFVPASWPPPSDRTLAIIGILISLIITKVAFCLIILAGHPLPGELLVLAGSSVGALIWVVRGGEASVMSRKVDGLSSSTQTLTDKVDQIHTLTNSNLEKTQRQLAEALAEVERLRRSPPPAGS